MEVIVTHETHFCIDDNGNVFTNNESGSGYNYFKRYLDVFDSVRVIGRAKRSDISGKFAVTGKNVSFYPIPDFTGPYEYIRNYFLIKKNFNLILNENKNKSSFIARSPGNMGFLLVDNLLKYNVPYGLEVVSDPYDVFAPGAVKSIWRPFFRIQGKRHLQKHCYSAAGISYVTSHSLQRRYPGNNDTYCTNYSSIMLSDIDFIKSSRNFKEKESYKLIYVGTLEQLYKGPDILIAAVKICHQNGVRLNLQIVGDGKFRSQLEIEVNKHGMKNCIQFLGRLPSGPPVRKCLDDSDLFVLPSRGEGLPRAMIEAMARGLPCVGTHASGIPELLPDEDLVPPNDAEMLADKISEVLRNPARMTVMSKRNLIKAYDFKGDDLRQRRREFYQHIQNCSKEYFRKNVRCSFVNA